jgi:hypothetical protein
VLGTDGSAAAIVSIEAGGHLHWLVPLRSHGSLLKPDQVTTVSRTVRIFGAVLVAAAFGTPSVTPSWSCTRLTAVDGNAPGPYNPNEPGAPQPARGD